MKDKNEINLQEKTKVATLKTPTNEYETMYNMQSALQQQMQQPQFEMPPQDYNLVLITDREGLILLRDIDTGAIFQVMKQPDGKAVLQQLNFGRGKAEKFLGRFKI